MVRAMDGKSSVNLDYRTVSEIGRGRGGLVGRTVK